MLLAGTGDVDGAGVLASVGAMLMSSLGYVLAKRWSAEVDVLASTSWQLLIGGLLLVPFAVATEGAPPYSTVRRCSASATSPSWRRRWRSPPGSPDCAGCLRRPSALSGC